MGLMKKQRFHLTCDGDIITYYVLRGLKFLYFVSDSLDVKISSAPIFQVSATHFDDALPNCRYFFRILQPTYERSLDWRYVEGHISIVEVCPQIIKLPFWN